MLAGTGQCCAIGYLDGVDHAMSGKGKYKRYMDDEIMTGRTKADLQERIEDMRRMCGEIGIEIHTEKVQIVPARHSFTYLKTTYKILETGKIIRKPWRMREKKHRRKLRLFRKLVDNGEMDIKDVENFQRSFCGSAKEFDAFYMIKKMQEYYKNLFPETTGAEKGGKGNV